MASPHRLRGDSGLWEERTKHWSGCSGSPRWGGGGAGTSGAGPGEGRDGDWWLPVYVNCSAQTPDLMGLWPWVHLGHLSQLFSSVSPGALGPDQRASVVRAGRALCTEAIGRRRGAGEASASGALLRSGLFPINSPVHLLLFALRASVSI